METIRRNIQTDIVRQRGQLNEAYEEQKALEKILDNTARLYSQTHLERQELVFTWRRAVAELHARERAIRDTIEVRARWEPAKFLSNFLTRHFRIARRKSR